jgi:hypothetical protein
MLFIDCGFWLALPVDVSLELAENVIFIVCMNICSFTSTKSQQILLIQALKFRKLVNNFAIRAILIIQTP